MQNKDCQAIGIFETLYMYLFSGTSAQSPYAAKSLISTSTARLYTLTDSRTLTAHPRGVYLF